MVYELVLAGSRFRLGFAAPDKVPALTAQRTDEIAATTSPAERPSGSP